MPEHESHTLELGPPPRQMPVMSVIGLVAVALGILIFGVTQWQNSKALDKIEHLQAQTATVTAARAPATRSSLCNLLQVAVSVVPPTDPERKRALGVLRQNIAALDCPAQIVELPPDVPPDLPP